MSLYGHDGMLVTIETFHGSGTRIGANWEPRVLWLRLSHLGCRPDSMPRWQLPWSRGCANQEFFALNCHTMVVVLTPCLDDSFLEAVVVLSFLVLNIWLALPWWIVNPLAFRIILISRRRSCRPCCLAYFMLKLSVTTLAHSIMTPLIVGSLGLWDFSRHFGSRPTPSSVMKT